MGEIGGEVVVKVVGARRQLGNDSVRENQDHRDPGEDPDRRALVKAASRSTALFAADKERGCGWYPSDGEEGRE
jgi:hypothetical protein